MNTEQKPDPGLSLAELDQLDSQQNQNTEIKPLGSDTPPSIDPNAAQEQTNQSADPNDSEQQEETQQEEEEEQQNDSSGNEASEESTEDVESFWKEVEQITGESIQIDYGGTDPLSPAGVALREMKIREDAALKFEQYLKQTDPRGYAYLLHREAGGSDEEFFAKKSFVLSDREEFENSIEQQSSLLKHSLTEKGVPEEVAQATIDKYIKDNVLKEKALEYYELKLEEDKKQVEQLEKLQEQEQLKFKTAVTNLTRSLEDTISSTDMKFIIPEASKAAFQEFMKSNIRHENGKFYIVNEIGNDYRNVKELVEAQYFQFVKGDLKKLVERKAKTLAVQRLKANVKRAAGATVKGSGESTNKSEYIPLGEI